jgi:4-hydroxybenzoate polyprenyltransferase
VSAHLIVNGGADFLGNIREKIDIFFREFLKKVKFLDIILLASFYLIRVYFGSQVADVPLTDWFLLTMTFVFLSLGINKRVLEIAMNG